MWSHFTGAAASRSPHYRVLRPHKAMQMRIPGGHKGDLSAELINVPQNQIPEKPDREVVKEPCKTLHGRIGTCLVEKVKTPIQA